jgi:hypothetical protein
MDHAVEKIMKTFSIKMLVVFFGIFSLSVLIFGSPSMAFAATPTCSTGQSLDTNSDGSWTCTISGGESTGDIITKYNADGTTGNQITVTGSGQTERTPSGEIVNPPKNTDPTSCDGFWAGIRNPGVCITRSLFAGIASFLIYIGVECLTASGLLFEAVLKYTVISFQTPMYTSVQDAVNNAWTVFRDISNILIIGFFTFIAISTILGITEYGAKKLLSRVLIVAVLINFSLLFTKLIIDASNFTAYQFYSASISSVDGQGKTSNSDTNQITGANGSTAQITGNGIAGTFIQYLGVTGFADSYNAVRNAQEKNDDASIGLVIGVLSFVFLIATALVFLYGSFILIARAVLFIFLLITSSLAFATYLIPKISDNYGWSKWWGALFKNAILAPILMMMLWATLAVASGISKNLAIANSDGSRGTIGALAQNPTSAGNISALLSFVIILGLLYASFRLASKFSDGIGGFSVARLGLGLAGFGALSATAGAAGLFGRNTLGRNAANNSLELDKKIKDHSVRVASLTGNERTKGLQELENLRKQKANADKTAKRDFNFMATSVGKAIAKRAGVAESKDGGGFAGPRKKAAEEAAKSAGDLVASQKEILEKIHGDMAEERKPHEKVITETKQVIQHEQESSGLAGQRAQANKELAELIQKSTAEKSDADSNLRNKTISQTQHKQVIDEQTAKISQAEDTIKHFDAQLAAIRDKHMSGAVVQHAEAQISEINKKMNSKETKDLASSYRKEMIDNAATVVIHETHADDFTAQHIRSKLKKDSNESGLLKELKKMQNSGPSTNTASAPAQTP